MSVATEIARIKEAAAAIRAKFVELGIAQTTDKLDDLATDSDLIENRGAVSANVMEGETYTIPKGYHNGSGTVSGVAGGGNYSLQSKSATPTTKEQNITPDSGYYGLSDVTVAPIPTNYKDISVTTATAADVLTGKTFVAADGTTATGTMAANGALALTIDGLTSTSATIPAGYTTGGTVSLTNDIETELASI